MAPLVVADTGLRAGDLIAIGPHAGKTVLFIVEAAWRVHFTDGSYCGLGVYWGIQRPTREEAARDLVRILFS